MTFPSELHAFGKTYIPKIDPPVVVRPPLWMHLEDKAAQGYIRACAPCPAVWTLKDDPHALLGEQWQYYLRAINHNMTLENVYLLMDDHLAFANDTGFSSLDNPGRADYFFRRDLSEKPPALNKVRTCSRNVLTGTVVGDKLRVTLFDSRQPPPLKAGRVYPSKVEDVKLDDYLYRPETHPWLFMTANIVNRAGEVVQFPRGAAYPWTGDTTIRSFLPHIANFEYGEVLYPLSRLRKLGESEAVPSPYRST
jgi:hypothetical protein